MKSNDDMAGRLDGRSCKDLTGHPVDICPYCHQEYVKWMRKQVCCGKYECRLAKNREMAKAKADAERKPLEPVPCAICQEMFVPYRSNNTVCKKKECKHASNLAMQKEWRETVMPEYDNLHAKQPKAASGKVRCKCPRCGGRHWVKMAAPDPPIEPRIYHPRCKALAARQSGYDFITSGAHLCGGLPGSERTPARMGVATL